MTGGTSGPSRQRGRRRSGTRYTGILHYVDRRRTYASLAMVVATILLCLAVGGPWWSFTQISYNPLTSVQVQNVHANFDLGGTITCSTYHWEPPSFPCANLTATLHGEYGILYEVYGYLALGLAELAGILSALLWVGNTGLNLGRRQLRAILILTLAFVVVSGSMLLGSAAMGPGPQEASFCYQYTGNVSNCPSYWGSVASGQFAGECLAPCQYTSNWGPGTAWYEVLAATALAGLAWALLWSGRKGPYSIEEHATWSATNRPLSLTGLSLPRPISGEVLLSSRVSEWTQAPAQNSVYPTEVSRETWRCLRCGRINSPWAGQCGYCREARPNRSDTTPRT